MTGDLVHRGGARVYSFCSSVSKLTGRRPLHLVKDESLRFGECDSESPSSNVVLKLVLFILLSFLRTLADIYPFAMTRHIRLKVIRVHVPLGVTEHSKILNDAWPEKAVIKTNGTVKCNTVFKVRDFQYSVFTIADLSVFSTACRNIAETASSSIVCLTRTSMNLPNFKAAMMLDLLI